MAGLVVLAAVAVTVVLEQVLLFPVKAMPVVLLLSIMLVPVAAVRVLRAVVQVVVQPVLAVTVSNLVSRVHLCTMPVVARVLTRSGLLEQKVKAVHRLEPTEAVVVRLRRVVLLLGRLA
jgi:hypothetical protein